MAGGTGMILDYPIQKLADAHSREFEYQLRMVKQLERTPHHHYRDIAKYEKNIHLSKLFCRSMIRAIELLTTDKDYKIKIPKAKRKQISQLKTKKL